ncbi:hypothetical protein GGD41_004770 [Paraburkholderia bryophila]|uniref:Uncharacterized protein n=1 Tax=Paraburkholderia bryophila TaxID=420952 RepID=A0A7Z0B2M7_9BURK|nr:hypothetical protein [Paraburkholderia bryophila]
MMVALVKTRRSAPKMLRCKGFGALMRCALQRVAIFDGEHVTGCKNYKFMEP